MPLTLKIKHLAGLIKNKNIVETKEYIKTNSDLISSYVNSDSKRTIFHFLCSNFNNEEDIIKFTLNLVQDEELDTILNIRDIYGETPLFDAIWTHNLNTFKVLVEYGADTKVRNIYGETLLHTAAQKKTLNEQFKCLLEIAPDLKDKRSGIGWTPLRAAAMSNQIENVKILLEYGSKIDFDIKTIKDLNIRNYLGEYQDLPSY